MSGTYAVGKFAHGYCDICGDRVEYLRMKRVFSQGKDTGWKACPRCWDVDHPLNFLPQAVAAHGADAEQLRGPRPEIMPTTYQVRFSPTQITRGANSMVAAVGVFAGYSAPTVTADDPGITISSAVLSTAMRVQLVITVDQSVALGPHLVTFTDSTGNALKGLLTIA